jgi:spore maturation protein CgeB
MKNKQLNVMIVGDYTWPWYQEACASAMEEIGCNVHRFGWFDDFKSWEEGHTEPFYKSFIHRLQHRFQFGPIIYNVTKRLIRESEREKPDVIWFYNVHLIGNRTLKKLRRSLPETIFLQYSNDDPFSKNGTTFLWRKFLSSIPLFDLHFVYRKHNINNFKSYGVKESYLLRAYFIKDEDFPVPAERIPKKFNCDVVFAGHYENDGRIEMLESICKSGYTLNLFGGGWNRALKQLDKDSPLLKLFPIAPVTGDNYRYAICGAKVAMCFLSTLNNDTYTRRNFQIPAMRTAMLSEHTEDLTSLYKADEEAMFFKNKEEMLSKLEILVNNNNLREAISKAGYKRVYKDGHDVVSRMKMLLDIITIKKRK